MENSKRKTAVQGLDQREAVCSKSRLSDRNVCLRAAVQQLVALSITRTEERSRIPTSSALRLGGCVKEVHSVEPGALSEFLWCFPVGEWMAFLLLLVRVWDILGRDFY